MLLSASAAAESASSSNSASPRWCLRQSSSPLRLLRRPSPQWFLLHAAPAQTLDSLLRAGFSAELLQHMLHLHKRAQWHSR